MFTDKILDHLLRDRRNSHEPCFTPVTLYMVFTGVTKTAMGLHGLVRSLKRGISCKPLSHIGFSTTGHVVVDHPRSFTNHQLSGVQTHLGFCQRECDALILANRTTKDDALVGVIYRTA